MSPMFAHPSRRASRVLRALAVATLLCAGSAQAAVNSYRFMHVTIDTPWYIFLFLLTGIFSPFVLMVVLMWRNSGRARAAAQPVAPSVVAAPAVAPPTDAGKTPPGN